MLRTFVVGLAIFLATGRLSAEEWQPANTHAVIVGVLEWQAGLTPYPKRSRKDQELRDVLVERGVPAGNIALLLDKEATLPAIRQAIAAAVEKAKADDTLIVYYAGHGWGAGDNFHFANYEVNPAKKESAWSLRELRDTLASGFRGQRCFFWADCCFSGGLEVAVDALSARKVAALSLTSAGTANTSTNNWTYTQSLIDGLRGEPLVDLDASGKITLAELHSEVAQAMQHREGQQHGFKASGLTEDFVFATAAGRRPATHGKFPIGSYVLAGGRYGRVVVADGERHTVQFYQYTDKVTEDFAAADLVASTRQVGSRIARLDAGVKPDCEVEWRGKWWEAKVAKTDKDRWYIHYLGYDNSWDEWVGQERIRFKQ